MKLPVDALIAPEKVTGHLLRQRPENDKATFLASAGYLATNSERLASDIRSLLVTQEAEFVESTEYGDKFRICGTLAGPNGRLLPVVSIWMIEAATGLTKFITLFPDKT